MQIKSFNQVSIKLYRKLREVTEDPSKSELVKSVEIVALLNDKTVDEVLHLPIPEFNSLVAETSFLDHPKLENLKATAPRFIKIGDQKFSLELDVYKWSTARFIDFQTFIKEGSRPEDKMYCNALACILVPEGKEYGKDYDPLEVARFIEDSLDIVTANQVFFYWKRRWLGSLKVIQSYLTWILKKAQKKDPKVKEVVDKIIQETGSWYWT